MNLSRSVSKMDQKRIAITMNNLQDMMKEVNPYVKDFIHICEIPDEELAQGQLVLSAQARPAGEHERRYNVQESLTEVSVLTNSHPHDLVLRRRGGGLQSVSDLNPSAMPLHFTLLFPEGTKGWDQTSKHVDGVKRVTPREFFAFHINVRDKPSDYLFRAGRLFQEFICMGQVTNENQKLNYMRMNQKAMRADTYKNVKEIVSERANVPLTDRMHPDDHNLKVGRKVLASSFIGGPRWYNAQFQVCW
jgi:hypothetical protein